MKNLVLIAGAALLGIAGTSGNAEATTLQFHGSQCVPASPTDAAKIGYDVYGVHNNASTAANVVCPINLGGMTSGRFGMTWYDRNTTEELSCDVYGTTTDGTFTPLTTLATPGSRVPAFDKESGGIGFAGSIVSAQMLCSIPAFQAGSGFSHLASYRLLSP